MLCYVMFAWDFVIGLMSLLICPYFVNQCLCGCSSANLRYCLVSKTPKVLGILVPIVYILAENCFQIPVKLHIDFKILGLTSSTQPPREGTNG